MQSYVRICLDTIVHGTNSYRMIRLALMSSAKAESRTSEVRKIHETFDDTVAFWAGYPLTTDIIAYRPTVYLRGRCKLAELLQEMHTLLLANKSEHTKSIEKHAEAIDHLAMKMERWFLRLPFELQYSWPMSVAVWELQYEIPMVGTNSTAG